MNKLAQIIREEIKKQALLKNVNKPKRTKLLKTKGKNLWEYITNKYDFEVTYDEPMYLLDIFKHDIKDNDEAYIDSEEFNTLEDVEEFIKDYK